MTKAEEIANQCAIKEEWFYGPLLKSINEALEWAAQLVEVGIQPRWKADLIAEQIRAGKRDPLEMEKL